MVNRIIAVKDCGRQFVLHPENKRISTETEGLIRRLLLERISLRGICRVVKVTNCLIKNLNEIVSMPHIKI